MQVMSSAGAPRPPMNPRTDMDNKISAAVEAGSISETDAAALEGALDSIDSALGSSGTSGSKLDPSEMKDRIDSLISDQVDAGTLTEEQAAELQDLFAQGPSGAGGPPPEMTASEDGTQLADIEGMDGTEGMGAMGGPGGPHGPGGPPPPPSDDSSETTSTDDSTSSVDDVLASMQAFLDNLRASMTSDSTYSTSGSGTSSTNGGLIIDQLA